MEQNAKNLIKEEDSSCTFQEINAEYLPFQEDLSALNTRVDTIVPNHATLEFKFPIEDSGKIKVDVYNKWVIARWGEHTLHR